MAEATTNPATVDISVPDLMDVIDQYAEAVRARRVFVKADDYRVRRLRASIERILTQEKAARRALEAGATS